jgi:hypothetical protein
VIILDQTKCAQAQADKNGILTMDDPFKFFLTANDTPINLNKRILISQKRDAPVISKKFQAHRRNQLAQTVTPRTEENNGLTDPNNIPTDDQNKSKSHDNTNKPEVIPINTADQQTAEKETITNMNQLLMEENFIPTGGTNHGHTMQGIITNTDPHDKTSMAHTLVITPTNQSTSKRIVNPCARSLHTATDPLKINQHIATNMTETTTPLTGILQTTDTDHHTPFSLLPKIITYNQNENNATPPSNMLDNTTSRLQIQHNNTPKKTKNIHTNNNLSNPCPLNLKQASNGSICHINLPQELEPLRTVILLQHTALENHIKELGSTCLNFTTVIEQKKESANKLHTDKRIPRSLRIKCELSISPSYERNPDFIMHKKELQIALNTFTTTGFNIIKKWSIDNIKLLTQDRCHNIMQQAVILLDGLYTYWKNILDPIDWPSQIETNPIYFLLKYISTKTSTRTSTNSLTTLNYRLQKFYSLLPKLSPKMLTIHSIYNSLNQLT